MDACRSYVINDNLGQDLVRASVGTRGRTANDPNRRWQAFLDLLRFSRLPSGL
jgi:hypothetical protein